MLHAGLIEAVLHVWAESATGSGANAALSLASHGMLREALAATIESAGPSEREASAISATAWLPGGEGGFTASSPLLDVPSAPSTGGLRPYAIDALALEGGALEAVLAAALERPVLAPGVLVGEDLAFWSRALGFAARLVAGRRYVPSLALEGEKREASYRARWRPLLGPAERATFASLAAAMPAACRALAHEDRAAEARATPERSASDTLRTFLEGAVDRLVRQAAAEASASGSSAGSKGLSARMREPVGGSVRGDAGGSAGGDGVLHDRWLRALRAPDATVSGTRTELRAFAQAVAEWTLALAREEDAEYRLLLRLEEPAFEGGEWFVRYLLQSQADRSLLVAAEVAWKKATLRRPLMEVLGRAARASERIDGSLREQRPEGFALDDAGAHAFLTEEAPQLEGAGLGILLPSWWTNRGTQLRLGVQAHAKASKAPSAGFRLDTIVAVNWKIALGEETLTARELAELARLKAPLVRLRGQWVVVESADIRAALELRERRAESMRLGDLMRLSLTGEGSANRLPIADVVASGELGKVLDRFAGRAAFEQLPPPSELRATLRPYQTRGYSWLHFLSRLGLGAALADDMGLGKTMQTLALVARDWAEGVREPVLLVCPTSVVGNWQREAARFAPDLPRDRPSRRRARARTRLPARGAAGRRWWSPATARCSATSRAAARRLARHRARRGAEHQEPADQAGQSGRARSPADYRIALTGTPVENHVGDLWSIMEFLNPGLLGTEAAFRREFLDADRSDGRRRGRGALASGSPRRSCCAASRPTEPSSRDLPDKLEMKVFCKLTQEQAIAVRGRRCATCEEPRSRTAEGISGAG